MVNLNFDILPNGKGYKLLREISYVSPRYRRRATVPEGYISDGASGPAEDIVSEAWWVHDILCSSGTFDDGAKCTNWMASWVLHDILLKEGRWFRARSWFVATGIFRPIWNCIEELNPLSGRRRK